MLVRSINRRRSTAAAIEGFRERFGVTDPRHAYGLARDRGSDLERYVLEAEQVKANVRHRVLGELTPSRSHGLELGR